MKTEQLHANMIGIVHHSVAFEFIANERAWRERHKSEMQHSTVHTLNIHVVVSAMHKLCLISRRGCFFENSVERRHSHPHNASLSCIHMNIHIRTHRLVYAGRALF